MLLTSFWNTTIAGGIYGLLSSTLIFFLTTLYNQWIQKKMLRQQLFKMFLEYNTELMIIIEQAGQNYFDYTKIRSASQNVFVLYLDDGEIKILLNELKRINLLEGNEYRSEKTQIPPILKKLYPLIIEKRDELL